MAKVSIIDWIVKKLKRCIAIVEDGDTASQAIASGKYVIWKGNAYKASSAISQGDTLSLSNLTAVSDGIGNELNSNLAKFKTYTQTVTTNTSGSAMLNISTSKIVLGGKLSGNGHFRLDIYEGNWWLADCSANTSYTVTLMYYES